MRDLDDLFGFIYNHLEIALKKNPVVLKDRILICMDYLSRLILKSQTTMSSANIYSNSCNSSGPCFRAQSNRAKLTTLQDTWGDLH